MIAYTEQARSVQNSSSGRLARRKQVKPRQIQLAEIGNAEMQFFPCLDETEYGMPAGPQVGFVVLMPGSHQQATERIREFVKHIAKHGVDILPDEDGNS